MYFFFFFACLCHSHAAKGKQKKGKAQAAPEVMLSHKHVCCCLHGKHIQGGILGVCDEVLVLTPLTAEPARGRIARGSCCRSSQR